MFLARVLTGRTAQSNPSYRRPPKDPETGRLFDSVSNGSAAAYVNPQQAAGAFGGRMGRAGLVRGLFGGGFGGGFGFGPGYLAPQGAMNTPASVYVVFDPMQHYPEYVIEF